MKMKIAALALLLAAGAAPAALAQEHGGWRHGGEGGDQPAGQPHGGGEHRGGERGPAPQARPAPQAQVQTAPPAQAAPAPQRFEGRRGGGEGRPAGGGGEGPRWVQAPQDHSFAGRHRDGAGPGVVQVPGQVSPPDRGGRRFDGARRPGPQGLPQVQQWGGERRDFQSPGVNRSWDGRGGRDQGWSRGGDQNWRGGARHDGPRWTPGRYPHSYASHRRFRIAPYVFPFGFYDHVWAYGDVLPQAYYVDDYLIEDWWDYDLPAPPPGYDWVRVGADAILVDQYSGRIVQVVRELFW